MTPRGPDQASVCEKMGVRVFLHMQPHDCSMYVRARPLSVP